jgi:hypothetical protein
MSKPVRPNRRRGMGFINFLAAAYYSRYIGFGQP